MTALTDAARPSATLHMNMAYTLNRTGFLGDWIH